MRFWIIFIFLTGCGSWAKLWTAKLAEDRCNGTWIPQPNTVNTTARLEALREQMRDFNISAYIITTNDNHQSEYVADHDKRRAYISGFSGSTGEAVVTLDGAALWTDSRYYIQAAEQLDCNWELMPTGEAGTPSIAEWLMKRLPEGAFVSADPKTSPYNEWEQWRMALEGMESIRLFVTTDNLVDLIWTAEEGRPDYPGAPLFVLDTKYAGLSWQEKLKLLRSDGQSEGVDCLILSALDEIAWTLNLRGGEVPFTPVFRSYLFIGEDHQTTLYLPQELMSPLVQKHLNSNGEPGSDVVSIQEYEQIWSDLEEIGRNCSLIGLPKPYSYAQGVSYLLHTMLPNLKIKDIISPALLRKDQKNDVESAGMRAAHIKDSVALCVFFARLQTSLAAGDNWTELSAVRSLDSLRWLQPDSFGPSFDTIAASGVNAALPHYEPSNATDRAITDRELFLVDSGGQYLDGTTDVTRTVHFGTPRAIEIKVYTALLMGCIDIATTTFPTGQTMGNLEILIRRPLFGLGLDYGHGSTHGIGSCLSVHEAFNSTYHLGFFGSHEPGYYKEEDFGMRLENIVTVVPATPMSESKNYLTFETVTLVPYDAKLINVTLLEKKHITWLNEYNQRVRDLVGQEMLKQGYEKEYQWLLENTAQLNQTD